MKIFTQEDVTAIEQHTLKLDGITMRTLIERMAEGAAAEIAQRWRPSKRIIVFAGSGNNGAQAIATTMQLLQRGYQPILYLFNIGGKSLNNVCAALRNEFAINFPNADFHEIINSLDQPDLGPSDLVIDGIFGADSHEKIMGGFKALVRYINESKATVVSLDIPTGLYPDWNKQMSERDVIHASLTLAVQYPRLAFFIPENAPLIGQWKIIDVGLSKEAAEQTKSCFHFIEESEIKQLLKVRQPFCSKADFGSACLVAGRYGMVGASVLSALGALNSGVGKLTVFGPQCSFPIVQTAVPEAMFDADENQLQITTARYDKAFDAYGIGPGIGHSEATINAVDSFIKSATKPIVVDADALNCIAQRPSLLKHLPRYSVLTPHDGEFDRLFGSHATHEARLLKALEVAYEYQIMILLKGHYTALARPDNKIYFNSTGCPAMATPGCGDVLTGIITSFMAQGYKPEVSAILAAFVHGKAGEMAEADHGQYGTKASDIAGCVGQAIQNIMQGSRISY